MDFHIADKLALVTGAAGDIGGATAMALGQEGANLLLTDIDADKLADDAAAIGERTTGEVNHVAADLTDEEMIDVLIRAAFELGGIDICVNAAGITGAKGDPLELSDDDWHEAWSIDFMSAVRFARRVVPPMADRGWGQSGLRHRRSSPPA